MNLIPWSHPETINIHHNESKPLSSLQNDVNRLFDNFFTTFDVPTFSQDSSQLAPSVDIIETDKDFKVEAELPGVESDNVDVSINDSYLTIKAEKKTSKEDQGKDYVRRERYYGTYQRTIALPETANADKAKATFKKGVLWIDIPKKEEAIKKSRKIEIKDTA